MALPQLFACLSHPLKEVEYDKSQEAKKGISIAVNKDVDIIFVIDDSGSMAEEQALLSENFSAFINVLEAEDVQANYRLAITTTDAGNPRCQKATTTPPNGNFELSSCVDRVGQGAFTFEGVDPPLDASYTCLDYCSLTDAELTIRPTSTEKDGQDKARPWLQNIEGETNLPDGISTVEAFQCFGPQGVAGCGFESHLESMYKALSRAETEGEDNYGFLRDQAILSVVFVTDEADCSYNTAHEAVFTTEKALWNDPNDPIPTSAVCWRAGVECDGEICNSTNVDIGGNKGVSDADAVLHPLSRYTDRLQGIEEEKKKLDAGAEVLVAVIGGVPPDYSGDPTEIPYEQSGLDPDFLTDFGTDPGCESAVGGQAVPPVRLREFAEAFQVGEDTNLFSICNPDYSPALKAIADKIRDQIKPACMRDCVADANGTTPYLDASCVLLESNTATGESNEIPECVKNGGNFEPPDGDSVCFVYLVDPDGAASPDNPDDDMSQECVDEGWNLEFRLFRTTAAPAGSSVQAICELSDLKEIDCPNL
ncbi:MAG: VWA domain-containing protein [Nannocystaceae bacterium]